MRTISVTLLFILCLSATGQQLPRRPFLGVQMTRVNDDTKRLLNLPSEKGVLIEKVIPGSSAEKAGFMKGDVLLKLNEKEINSPDEAVRFVAQQAGTRSFSYELIRAQKLIKGKSVLSEMPREEHEDLIMEYKAVQTVNGLQRLIVSRAKRSGRQPVVLFIGGIGCYSLDFPFEKTRSEVQLLNKLSREGFVCIRAEKPGVGDNVRCTPCHEVSFGNEVSGYVAAVKAIKNYEYVDSTSIFIFGHSMGGVMAPLVAAQTSIKGVIAFGTIGSSFPEYLPKTRRTLAQAYEMDPVETEDYIKAYSECAGYYFTEGMTTQQATEKNKDCEELLSVFDLRSREYNKQLYQLNIAGAWKTFSGKALLLYGKSDFVASEEDHRIIAETVNRYHKGNASYVSIEATSHAMNSAADFVTALRNDGPYNPRVAEFVLEWLKKTV